MRWCCWRCWWRLPSPRWESCWWWWGRWFPPLGGKSPRRNRIARGKKCSCSSSASRWRPSVTKVLSLFFYVKMTYIPEDGHRRWAWVSTTHHLITTPQCIPLGPKMVKRHVVDVHITPLREPQHTYQQNIERISNSHDYLQQDFSRDLKKKSNYSQMITMLKIRGVCLRLWAYNLPPNKPTSINYKE